MADSNSSSGGIGICGCLFLIFLTLKLAEVGTVAKWSWWWVCSPLWLPFVILVPVALVVYAIASIGSWLETRRNLKSQMRDDL
jgi:hypothetical protein